MLERVRNLRQRNYVFVDTLQGYYTGFSEDMYTPYQEWRKLSYEEVVAETRTSKAEANRAPHRRGRRGNCRHRGTGVKQ